ncbi:MAG TPA: glycosyltransferase family 4 protein [Xanthomonadaceae bacterium]|jgi:colanic acid biosynthesis glycosyl transferase WcaI|nr:glycosyltransferase family 4 protein [Xanthomonadaceae bacterium]
MKILVHDYSGHPFQVQLSRELARRGHGLLHLYNGSNPTTPKGAVDRRPEDAGRIDIDGIKLPRAIEKSSFVDRWKLERLYGKLLYKRIADFAPDVVVSANTPLDALVKVDTACRSSNTPWVFWLQDLIGEATDRILREKLPVFGGLIGAHYRRMETGLLKNSSFIVGITDDFANVAGRARVPANRYATIPNWAPLDEILPRPKDNPWAREHGLADRFVFLYSGTLGFKHNPRILLELTRSLNNDSGACVVVNSQGDVADWLRAQAKEAGLANLHVNPYQPHEAMSDVLGTADVLVSILEPDAGVFSVPSKVLSYHCAGRPMLLAVPASNLASRIVTEEGTGKAVDPGDVPAFVAAAHDLWVDGAGRAAMSNRARAYAERTFDINRIADQFERILFEVVR